MHTYAVLSNGTDCADPASVRMGSGGAALLRRRRGPPGDLACAYDLSTQPLAGTQRVLDSVGRMTGHASLSNPGLARLLTVRPQHAALARAAPVRLLADQVWVGGKKRRTSLNSFAEMAT